MPLFMGVAQQPIGEASLKGKQIVLYTLGVMRLRDIYVLSVNFFAAGTFGAKQKSTVP